MSTAGRSLELYLIDGRPDGMLTAEVFNWTGHVLSFPRTSLAEAMKRQEAARSGVYLLLGEDSQGPLVYVGESEDIGDRFKAHEAKKDWWTRAVIVTTAGNALNKAHIRYLEARLHSEAKSAGTRLDNGNTPGGSGLSEASRANMEAFLDNLLMILPVLRIDAFSKPTVVIAANAAPTAPVFVLNVAKGVVSAEAVYIDGELVVRKGSLGRAWSSKGIYTSYKPLYDSLVNSGVLVVNGNATCFSVDQAFGSPSAAATVLNGQALGGQTAWKLKNSSKTYKDWEQSQLLLEAAE